MHCSLCKWKYSENITPNMPLCVLTTSNWRQLGSSKCREWLSLSFLDLPKDWIIQKELPCNESFPQKFYQPGKIDSDHRGENWKLTPCPDYYYLSDLLSAQDRLSSPYIFSSCPAITCGPPSPLRNPSSCFFSFHSSVCCINFNNLTLLEV